jgi:uncharacterized protein
MAAVLDLTRFDSVDAFEGRALPFLLEREAEHNLFIGICGQIRDGRYDEAYLAVVSQGDRVVAASWRTPPHNVGISCVDHPDAVDLIAQDVRAVYDTIPGVLAAKQDAARFVARWTEMTGRPGHVAVAQRIHQATSAAVPSGVPGEMRLASRAERSLLVDWHDAFNAETSGTVGSTEANVDYRLAGAADRGLVLWYDEDRPVSMAGFGGPTPHGSRVGPVYTPPELRGRGYATACVSTLTQRLLDEGRRFVFLYTDLANPTSNSIYRKIGYRPVCDVDQYRFD